MKVKTPDPENRCIGENNRYDLQTDKFPVMLYSPCLSECNIVKCIINLLIVAESFTSLLYFATGGDDVLIDNSMKLIVFHCNFNKRYRSLTINEREDERGKRHCIKWQKEYHAKCERSSRFNEIYFLGNHDGERHAKMSVSATMSDFSFDICTAGQSCGVL